MRDWVYLFRKESYIKIKRNEVIVENIRDHKHKGKPVYRYFTKKFNLKDLKAVWLAVDPLEIKAFSHLFITFDFGKHNFVVSVEGRRKEGQRRPIVWGTLSLIPVGYFASTERDIFELRSDVRNHAIYLYKLKLTSVERVKLLRFMASRMDHVHGNELRFNTIFRNCTTEVLNIIRMAAPAKFNSRTKTYWNTKIDLYLHKTGFLETSSSLKELRKKHNVSPLVKSYTKGNFSNWIRKGIK